MLNREYGEKISRIAFYLVFKFFVPSIWKFKGNAKRAWFLWTPGLGVEFYGELGRSKGNERNGQISVNAESGISKASRGGNINVDTSISDRVLFFLEFVLFFITEGELVGVRWNVPSRPREELLQCKERTKRNWKERWGDCRLKLAFFVTRLSSCLIDSSWPFFVSTPNIFPFTFHWRN